MAANLFRLVRWGLTRGPTELELAARWRGRASVWSYDLMNEPVWSWDGVPDTPVATGCIGDECFDF